MNRLAIILLVTIGFCLPVLSSSASDGSDRQSLETAIHRLFLPLSAGSVVAFVEMTDAREENSSLAHEYYQRLEPKFIAAGRARDITFIERRSLKLIMDEWALDSLGEEGDRGARRLLGADYILTGKVNREEGFDHCTFKLTQLGDGRIVAMAEGWRRRAPGSPEPPGVAAKPGPDSGLVPGGTMVAQSNDGILTLWTDKRDYRPGENMIVAFQVKEPRYVRIFDVTPAGEVTDIFPNPYQPDGHCRPGITYRIPPPDGRFALEITPPAGIDRLMAIASTAPLDRSFSAGTRGVKFTHTLVEAAESRAVFTIRILE